MFLLLRIGLYLSTLWGVLALAGLAKAMPTILLVLDVLPILPALHIVLAKRRTVWPQRLGVLDYVLLPGTVAFVGLNLMSGMAHGASLIAVVQYVGALVRPLALAIVLASVLQGGRAASARKVRKARVIVRDLRIIVCIQFAAAAVQLADPRLGALFIPEVSETQSAFAALDLGHVSGLFPNSIDFGYFAVAAYVVWTLDLLIFQKRLPHILTSLMFFLFIGATGSATATGCYVTYFTWLHFRVIPKRYLAWILSISLLSVSVVALAYESVLLGAVSDKIDNMMLSRLGLLFISTPNLVAEQPSVLLVGLGADFSMIALTLGRLPDGLAVLAEGGGVTILNDVFWFALVISLGAPLAYVYSSTMLKLIRKIIGPLAATPDMTKFYPVLVFIIIFAGFFNQILLVRSFYSALLIGTFCLAYRLQSLANSPAKNQTKAEVAR